MIQEKKMYKYSGKWIHFFLGLIIFGSSTVLFYYKATNNNESFIIKQPYRTKY